MLVYIHSICGNPAMQLVSMPSQHEKVRASNFRHMDGSAVTPGSAMTCDVCGGSLAAYGEVFPQRSRIQEVEE